MENKKTLLDLLSKAQTPKERIPLLVMALEKKDLPGVEKYLESVVLRNPRPAESAEAGRS